MKQVGIITLMLLIVIFSGTALAQYSAIMGVVTDTASNPVRFTYVYNDGVFSVQTDSAGSYQLMGLEAGEYDVRFWQMTSPYHSDTTVLNGSVAENEITYLDITLLPEPSEAFFYAGGSFDEEYQWHDTIYAGINQWIDIPIYFMGDAEVAVENMNYPLAARYDLINEFDEDECQLFYPLTRWWCWWFQNNNDDTHPTLPNPTGYHSLSFGGYSRGIIEDSPLLRSEVPLHILSFRVHTIDDPAICGQIYDDALTVGMDSYAGPARACDSTWDINGCYSLYLS